MPAFRKKPVVVQAEQYSEYGIGVRGVCQSHSCYAEGNDRPHVHTIHRRAGEHPPYLDGQIVNLEVGDWVIDEGDGRHFYPVKPDIFAAIYEPVDEDAPPPADPALLASANRALSEQLDDLRRQLAEAESKHLQEYKARMVTDGMLLAVQADNAALVEAIGKMGVGQVVCGDTGMPFACKVCPACIKDAVKRQPHPGAPLLEEVEVLRKALKAIADLLPPTLPAPMPNLAHAWAEDQRLLYKAVLTARDAIRNREGQ